MYLGGSAVNQHEILHDCKSSHLSPLFVSISLGAVKCKTKKGEGVSFGPLNSHLKSQHYMSIRT